MRITKIEKGVVYFSDGSTLTDYHEQDCCESVYADFNSVKDQDLTKEFDEIQIERVPDSGFRLNGIFVPCYNQQNGYYSDELSLIIKRPGKPKETLDISECVLDQID